ncbi:hypothetical protein BRADI_3g36007v3 [Brachypodium distachyon]|uniref:Uncharacterized protein n=1 Tax=Brachypodium distachyon TaxID=15368 RepID=A0A2K2D1G7_BRADI|nr:hypothetical protein BRADI_3g36007v3 [Brachypodium distachyon]
MGENSTHALKKKKKHAESHLSTSCTTPPTSNTGFGIYKSGPLVPVGSVAAYILVPVYHNPRDKPCASQTAGQQPGV